MNYGRYPITSDDVEKEAERREEDGEGPYEFDDVLEDLINEWADDRNAQYVSDYLVGWIDEKSSRN